MSFYLKIKDQVAAITKIFGYPNDGTAFGHFILRECFSKVIDFGYDGSDLDNFIKEHIVDMANDLGNDAIIVNPKTREISVFQFKFSNECLLNTDEIKKNKRFIDWILKINQEQLSPNYKLKKIYEEEISVIFTPEALSNNDFTLTFYYVDNCFGEAIKMDIEALFNNFNDKGINFKNKFYSYEELEQLHDDVEIPKNEVTLRIVPNEYFIKRSTYHDQNETKLETIVANVIANSLKPIIKDKKELLLALNVRYYKGENEINSKIKREYCKGKKSNFWILNNGINAICEDYNIDGEKLTIKNFQIVNGGQTTKTLEMIVNDLPDEVQIMMRLTKIQEKTRTSKISMDIAVSSNSQNAISPRDLHSGDRIQSKIFNALDSVNIFYDKKDGEWATIANKKKYRNPLGGSPMHLKIHNIDLGIDYMSFFLQVPISSIGRHKLIFSEFFYDKIFDMSVSEADQFFKLMLAHRVAERVTQVKAAKFSNFEILQNNYINDVLTSLTGLYFFKDDLNQVRTINELVEKLKEIQGQKYLNPEEQYSLSIDQTLDLFILEIIRAVQYILDAKKAGKKDFTGEDWLPTETNNWLKRDGTYKEIFEKTKIKLGQ